MERDFFRKYSSFSFQIRKNNNQTVSGGKRQGKVFGIVTPVSAQSSFQLRKTTLGPTSRAELFCQILSLFGAIARWKNGLRCAHEKWKKIGTLKLNIFRTLMIWKVSEPSFFF